MKKTKLIQHDIDWFLNRIGKMVYRNPIHGHPACCETCKRSAEFGIFIRNITQAKYLHMVQFDLGVEYRDKK
jgi:hypothetical protein